MVGLGLGLGVLATSWWLFRSELDLVFGCILVIGCFDLLFWVRGCFGLRIWLRAVTAVDFGC